MIRHFSCGLLCISVLSPLGLSGCAEKIDTPEEYLQLAYRHERSAQLPEAVAAYRKALELNEKQPTAWYDLGVAYAAMDQFPDAITAYSKAIELDTGMARAFNNRAAAYARLRQFDKAIADCDRAVTLDPDDFLAWRNRGLARHDHGDSEKAIADYDESIRINGRVAETYHSRGNVFLDRKQWSRALEDFDQAIHLDGNMSAAWLSRAITLARLGRGHEAEASRIKAGELGSEVDDVVIADLIPDSAGPVVSSDSEQQALKFVLQELNKSNPPATLSSAPWNFQKKIDDTEQKYIVRILAADGKGTTVSFSSEELEKLEQHQAETTLVIVRPIAPDATSLDQSQTSASSFEIIRTIEHWAPDRSAMTPVLWSWPLLIDSKTPNQAPVVSAAP